MKQVQRVLQFFCESDALAVFTCGCKLFNTVSEDMAAERRKYRPVSHQEETPGPDDAAGATKIVSKAVALFDFSDPGSNFAFKTGDIVFLTTEKRDLRVRGRLEHASSSQFALLPRDYVEVRRRASVLLLFDLRFLGGCLGVLGQGRACGGGLCFHLLVWHARGG